MSDIVDRLRGRVHVREAAELLYAAAEEIERLRIIIDRASKAWMQCSGVAWEGDLADAVEAGVAEIARLNEISAKLWDIAASSIDPPERRRMLDRLGMDSFSEDG